MNFAFNLWVVWTLNSEAKSQKTLQKVKPIDKKTKTKSEDTEKKEIGTDINLLKADTKEKVSETKDADDP